MIRRLAHALALVALLAGSAAAQARVPIVSDSVAALELGTRVTPSVPGQVVAIRAWTLATDRGPHVGHIWSASGALLATVPFTGETASGWQQQALAVPLRVTPGTALVVSVNVPAGAHFPLVTNGYAAAQTQGTLGLPASAGRYGPPGAYPISASPNDYFRDLGFVADVLLPALATVTTGLGATAAAGTLAVPGRVTGLTAGLYTVTLTVTDPWGRVVTSQGAVLVDVYPIARTDAPRRWAYTITTAAGESLPSQTATTPPTTDAGPFYAVIDLPPLPADATAWTLYRTAAGAPDLRRVAAAIAATTRTYADHVLDGALGAAPPTTTAVARPMLPPRVSGPWRPTPPQ